MQRPRVVRYPTRPHVTPTFQWLGPRPYRGRVAAGARERPLPLHPRIPDLNPDAPTQRKLLCRRTQTRDRMSQGQGRAVCSLQLTTHTELLRSSASTTAVQLYLLVTIITAVEMSRLISPLSFEHGKSFFGFVSRVAAQLPAAERF